MYSSLEITVLVHATEDGIKIKNKILEYINRTDESLNIVSQSTEGHWKNPIHVLKISITKEIDDIFRNLVKELNVTYGDDSTVEYLKHNTNEKGFLFIRLDKQKFMGDKIFIHDADPIRLIFKTKNIEKNFLNSS